MCWTVALRLPFRSIRELTEGHFHWKGVSGKVSVAKMHRFDLYYQTESYSERSSGMGPAHNPLAVYNPSPPSVRSRRFWFLTALRERHDTVHA